MSDENDSDKLARDIFGAAARGAVTDAEELHAMLAVAYGAPLMKPVESPEREAAGMRTIVHTRDTEGEPLRAGGTYLLRGKRVMVLREEFGAGNIISTYYRVFYLNSDFKEEFVVVDGKQARGGGLNFVYRSEFVPIREDEQAGA